MCYVSLYSSSYSIDRYAAPPLHAHDILNAAFGLACDTSGGTDEKRPAGRRRIRADASVLAKRLYREPFEETVKERNDD